MANKNLIGDPLSFLFHIGVKMEVHVLMDILRSTVPVHQITMASTVNVCMLHLSLTFVMRHVFLSYSFWVNAGDYLSQNVYIIK